MANTVNILIKADDQASKVIDGVGNALGKVAVIAGAATFAGIAAGLTASFNAAANFEQAISAVGAVSQATDAQLAELAETGKRIGRETAFSALEAAGAMEILAQNGISTTDIMNGAADAAVALAAAGGTDLATAADLASTAMSVWGLETKDLTDVVNRMAGAANVSKFGVEDMAYAVAMGGGAAASAGMEFGDFTTAIAAIAPYFASGSDAGTSFKQFLAGLTPTAAKTKDLMRDLGLITEEAGNRFFDAQGNLKSMAEISDVLNVATKDLTEMQKAQALETIFGSDAMRAAAAISKMTGEEFAAMDKTMRESDAAEIAAKRMDNARGAMEQLKGAIEVLAIDIGSTFTPAVEGLALKLANDVLPGVNALVGAFKDGLQGTDVVVGDFGEIQQAGIDLDQAPVPATLNKWEVAAQTLGEKLGILGDNFRQFAEEDAKPAATNVGIALDEMQGVWDKVSPVVMGHLDELGVTAGKWADLTGTSLKTVTDLIGGDFKSAWDGAKETVKLAWETMGLDTSTGTNKISGLLDELNSLTDGKLGEFAETFRTKGGEMLTEVGTWPGRIQGAMGDAGNILSSIGSGIVTGFRLAMEGDFSGLVKWVTGWGSAITNAIGRVDLSGIGYAIINGLLSGMQKAWEATAGWLAARGEQIKNLKGPIEEDRRLLEPEGRAIMEGLANGMESGFDSQVTPFLASVEQAIAQWGSGIVSQMSATYAQALAISAAIRAAGASGSTTPVLGGTAVAAAGTSSTPRPPLNTPPTQPSHSGTLTQADRDYIDWMNRTNAGLNVTVNVQGSVISAERDITRIVRDTVLNGGFQGVIAQPGI